MEGRYCLKRDTGSLLGGTDNILYLVLDGVYIILCICKNASSCIFDNYVLYCRLYINKIVFKRFINMYELLKRESRGVLFFGFFVCFFGSLTGQ